MPVLRQRARYTAGEATLQPELEPGLNDLDDCTLPLWRKAPISASAGGGGTVSAAVSVDKTLTCLQRSGTTGEG